MYAIVTKARQGDISQQVDFALRNAQTYFPTFGFYLKNPNLKKSEINLSSKLNIESKGTSTYALERKEKTLENPHILLFFTLHYLDNAPSKHPKNIDLS